MAVSRLRVMNCNGGFAPPSPYYSPRYIIIRFFKNTNRNRAVPMWVSAVLRDM